MLPVENEQLRLFKIRFKDGSEVRVNANTMCRPKDANPFYTFKVGGETVAEFHGADVSGWLVS